MIRLQTYYVSTLLCLVISACNLNKPLASITPSNYQQKDSLLWISIIDSPNVNYYEAVASFEKYWEHRQPPVEPDGEGKPIFEKEVTPYAQPSNSIQYVYEYKRFLNWQQRNKNLVKPDGRIMTADEIINEWKKRQTDSLTK